MSFSRNVEIIEIETSGTGTTPEGAISIGVINTGAGTGYMSTLEGQGKIPPGTSKTFPASTRTYGPLVYDGTGTTLLITIVK